ncbi:MAG: hypothetical protein NVS2B17_14860 [Candidatus Velthaea sp.]
MRIHLWLPAAACAGLLFIAGCASKEPQAAAPTDAPAPAATALIADGATLPPGAAFTAVQNNCQACHSLDMVYTQRLSPATWTAEVMKMKKFGAPLSGGDTAAVISYLSKYLAPDSPRSGKRERHDAPAITTANPPAAQ